MIINRCRKRLTSSTVVVVVLLLLVVVVASSTAGKLPAADVTIGIQETAAGRTPAAGRKNHTQINDTCQERAETLPASKAFTALCSTVEVETEHHEGNNDKIDNNNDEEFNLEIEEEEVEIEDSVILRYLIRTLSFKEARAREALSATGGIESDDLGRALDWLCLNIDNEELQEGFTPRVIHPGQKLRNGLIEEQSGGQRVVYRAVGNLKVITKQDHLDERLILGLARIGFSRDEAESALALSATKRAAKTAASEDDGSSELPRIKSTTCCLQVLLRRSKWSMTRAAVLY